MRKLPDLDEQLNLCALTGKLDRTYRLKGTICPKVVLDSHTAIMHSGYTLIDLDLEDAQEYLKEAFRLKGERTFIPPPNAKLHEEFVLPAEGPVPRGIKALWISAVIIYAKCFADAKGRRVKLEKSNIPAHMRVCHEKILKYRNTLVAHAGEGSLESALPELVIGPKSEPFYWIKSNVKRVEFVDDRNERVTFQDLLEAVHKHVIEKREKHMRKLLEDVKKTPLNTWYARAALAGPGGPAE